LILDLDRVGIQEEIIPAVLQRASAPQVFSILSNAEPNSENSF
jgi:hypothetical protein